MTTMDIAVPEAQSGDAAGPFEHIDFPVTGMTCNACAARLEKALSRQDGIKVAHVNFALERADIDFDPSSTDGPSIAQAVQNAGFGVADRSFSFGVEGMTCAACSGRLEKALKAVPGVTEASVNLVLERADVSGLVGVVTLDDLVQAVDRAGYTARVASESEEQARSDEQFQAKEKARLRKELWILLTSALLTTPLVGQMVAMNLGSDFHMPPAMEALLATPVQFVIGLRFYKSAYKALAARSANMDVLVAMGTSAAYFYSFYLFATLGAASQGQLYFEASAVIITLVLFGKYLEARAKRGTTAAIRSLMDLRPETARVLRGGKEVELPVSDVLKGDLVIIRPGERVPVDGTVKEGQSELDESLITGESLPVIKQPGTKVTGGSINGTGLLKVEATAVGKDSTLSKIIRLVENAQTGKAPVQRLVDRISEIFVPVVIGIAVLTFIVWMVVSGDFETSLIAAVSVLVIACPCALGLATPTAIVTGTGSAARAGILIKDIAALERAHRLDTIIFDKTGTLTEGHPAIVGTHAMNGESSDMLRLAASVQQGSEHPLAKAFVDRAADDSLALSQVTEFRSFTGLGVAGVVDGVEVALGNRAFMAERHIDTASCETIAAKWESEGRTAIWIVANNELKGLAALADPVRPEAAAGIRELKRLGIKTIMLTGDAEAVAQSVAREVGVDVAKGPVRPEDKAQEVVELVAQGHAVGMIGDGINDAPALAAADVSIAMGTGTDIAMETAGITLMRPDPRLVAAAISVSRATWNKIWQNLFWAFIYNVIGIPLAALGMLTPAIAAAAMAMSSVSVVSNSLLLRRWKPKLID